MNLTRPTASALSGLLVASMVVTVPARAQEGDDLGWFCRTIDAS